MEAIDCNGNSYRLKEAFASDWMPQMSRYPFFNHLQINAESRPSFKVSSNHLAPSSKLSEASFPTLALVKYKVTMSFLGGLDLGEEPTITTLLSQPSS